MRKRSDWKQINKYDSSRKNTSHYANSPQFCCFSKTINHAITSLARLLVPFASISLWIMQIGSLLSLIDPCASELFRHINQSFPGLHHAVIVSYLCYQQSDDCGREGRETALIWESPDSSRTVHFDTGSGHNLSRLPLSRKRGVVVPIKRLSADLPLCLSHLATLSRFLWLVRDRVKWRDGYITVDSPVPIKPSATFAVGHE